MLYRVAMETGLRRKELRTLTPDSFDFDSVTPSVFVEAGESKNHCKTLLPIRSDLANELREWFQTAELSSNDVLRPNLTQHTAKMLKADLEAAGIAYVDDAGLFADFHSLRQSFISMLAAGNVHPKLTQRLARHSDINLTMSRYSHTLLADEATALDALPKLPSAFDEPTPQTAILKATGTDPKPVENVLPFCLPEHAALDGISGHQMAISRCVEQALSQDAKAQETTGNPVVSAGCEAERTGRRLNFLSPECGNGKRVCGNISLGS